MFNLSGTEIIVILLLALVILGPEKLPEAMRKAGRAYSELRKMANSFQSEVRSVLDEPMNELRGTADAIRDATKFTDDDKKGAKGATTAAKPVTNPPAVEEEEPLEAAPPSPPSNDDLDEDGDDDEGPGEDVITRTLSGDVDPGPPTDQAGSGV